ncbi:MAG: EamA family transporter [Lautropia sp.]
MFAAAASATFFAGGLIAARFGLDHLPVRVGATFSVPSAFVLFASMAPWTIDWAGFVWPAAIAFAAIGLFFPAAVTLLSFHSTEKLGSSATAAISGTAPLFAIPAAALVLDEPVPGRALAAAAGIAIGIALLSWNARRGGTDWRYLWLACLSPAIRALAQVLVKASMLWWPSAFAAALFGYGVSSVVLIGYGWRRGPPLPRAGIGWFGLTGLCNGLGVLLFYWSVANAPVALVSPILATVPLIAVLIGFVVFRDRRPSLRESLGIAATVASVVWLVTGRHG